MAEGASKGSAGRVDDPARANEEHELEAEEESAAAMDADVPQPPDSSQTGEGQPA
jgi:hypothetical protein